MTQDLEPPKDLFETHDMTVISIWRYDDAPMSLKSLVSANFHWIAFVPTSLVSEEADWLLLRHTNISPVSQTRLSDGSVVFAGCGWNDLRR